MSEPLSGAPVVFAPSPWRTRFLLGLTVVFDAVFLAIAVGVGTHNAAVLIVSLLLVAGATLGATRLVRLLDRRIEITATELRVMQGSREVLAIERSRVARVRIWYHEMRFTGEARGMFVWDTEDRPVAYVGVTLPRGAWERLVAELGVPAPPLRDDERRWLIRHSVAEGGTGGIGLGVLDRVAEPLVRPGWYPARAPSEGLNGPG